MTTFRHIWEQLCTTTSLSKTIKNFVVTINNDEMKNNNIKVSVEIVIIEKMKKIRNRWSWHIKENCDKENR